MSLTMQEVCIFHLYRVQPSEMVYFMNRWSLSTAVEYHNSLVKGSPLEQATAASLTTLDVYQIMQTFLAAKEPCADEDIMGAYIIDQGMYEKLRQYLHGAAHYKEAIA